MTIPKKYLEDEFGMPELGIGTWHIGGTTHPDHTHDEEQSKTIQDAIDLGYTHIDTAELYARGHTEEIVGKAIKKYDRKKLFLSSKVSGEHLRYEEVIESCHNSLKRLQTDYLDLYLVHFPNPEVPIAHTMKAMDHLLSEKLVKHIGVSNFSRKRFEEAQFYTGNKLIANQLHYNLIYREVETDDLLPFCENNDIFLIAYRPLQEGLLVKKGVPILDEMAEKYHKTPAQIAINWLISQSNVITITKATSKEHLKENAEATGWQMSPKDIERLRKEFPGQQMVSNARPLK